MTKKILVTGAEGFIGSHLVETLISQGHSVRSLCLYNSFNNKGWLDDLPPQIKQNNEVILGDIRDFDSVNKAMQGVEVVFHLAALIAIPYSYAAPESYVDTNIKGTLNILRAALLNNVQQVIHTSTSEVYGTAQFIPITEEHPLVGQSPYSATKIAADQLAYSFYCAYNLPVSIVRPFNTFGPRQSSRAIIPTIINQILAKNQVLQLGNIDATRDFNYVLDTVGGMLSFMGNTASLGEVINIGSGVEISICDLANLISEIAEFPIEIQVDSKRIRPEKSEVERLCAANAKAFKLLGWSPAYTLKQGLENTFTWFQQYAKKHNLIGTEYVI